MLFLIRLLFAFSCLLVAFGGSEEEPIAKLSFGKIRGKNVDGLISFTNIPYAEPPIGIRRFEPPVIYNHSWTVVKNGRGPAKTCITFGGNLIDSASEDCLYLHVFTPSIKCTKYYPVRVHLHGGAYMIGSAVESDPSSLVKNGMVVVTIGYRLGPLGFLSTGDREISGNNGLKDQRLAIRWTKANIQSFCGDPNEILLAGESAGGAAAHLHLLQKSTENYVNAIASHNGVTICPWAFETNPRKICTKFADYLNCSVTSSSFKTCLQSKTIDELRAATTSLQYYKGNPFTVFAPVVEAPGAIDPFLSEHPEVLIRSGRVANITWLVAYAEREGSCNAANFLTLDATGSAEINILNEQWLQLAPILLFYNDVYSNPDHYSNYLRSKYLGVKKFSEENYRLLEDMYSDVLFKDPIKKAITLHRKYCNGKVYVYYYKYPHKYGIGNLLCSRTNITFDADHMSDTIFTMPLMSLKQTKLSQKERNISQKLIDLYKSLAITGIPKFDGKQLPLNTKTENGMLTLKENCYSIYSSERQIGNYCHNYY